jgi:murein DD-endopeptidase MepM/ murein hydrolase activator NlpD
VDVAAAAGQQVHSMADGRVLFAGTVAGIPVITVDHGGDLRSTYEPVVATVVEGDRVRAGQAIGAVAGVGGHCGGDLGCIHVGLRQAHRYLDPTPFLTPAVLKTLRRPPEGGPAGR